jgi:hypothetical protein
MEKNKMIQEKPRRRRTYGPERVEPKNWLGDLLDAIYYGRFRGEEADGARKTILIVLDQDPVICARYHEFKAWGGRSGKDWRRWWKLGCPTRRSKVIATGHLVLVASRRKTRRVPREEPENAA